MFKPKCCTNGCLADRRVRSLLVVAFGLGMTLASICPSGLTLFIAAIILVVLGITLACG